MGFWDSAPARVLGACLLCYGLFNTYLFIKFTPVYSATSCGQQTATLDKFEIGQSLQVGLQIKVICWNPNSYEVQIMHDRPGQVFIGRHRDVLIGNLTLLRGSSLPAAGSGTILAQVDAEIDEETTHILTEEFLDDSEIPIYLELQFN
ncbi:unnamed protein product, partial [Polarella glacialis]